MYRRRTTEVRLKLFRSVKKEDQIASTLLRSRIQNLGTDVSFRIHVFSALVNSDIADPYSADTIQYFRAI